jgi:hypothetical protein
VIINKQDHYLTASEITSGINESLPMYTLFVSKDPEFGFIGPENFFPLPNCPMLMFFGPLQTFALFLYACAEMVSR